MVREGRRKKDWSFRTKTEDNAELPTLAGIKHSKAQYGSELSININTKKADIKNWGSMDVSDANEDEVSVMTQ